MQHGLISRPHPETGFECRRPAPLAVVACLFASPHFAACADDGLATESDSAGSNPAAAVDGSGAASGSSGGAAGASAASTAGAFSNASGGASAAAQTAAPGDGGATPGIEGEVGELAGVTLAHNQVRRALGLTDLEWSDALAEHAQDWADTLSASCDATYHRPDGAFGENIAVRASSPFRVAFSAAEAVGGWVAEEACWDYGSIRGTESCDAACIAGLNSTGCGHYTQVVWSNTRRLGCGYSTCERGGLTVETWVCNYDPPGNFIGQAPY